MSSLLWSIAMSLKLRIKSAARSKFWTIKVLFVFNNLTKLASSNSLILVDEHFLLNRAISSLKWEDAVIPLPNGVLI